MPDMQTLTHLEKTILAYLSVRNNYLKISNFDFDGCSDGLGSGARSEGAKTKFLTEIARDLARHILKSRPRPKSKKVRIERGKVNYE